MAKPTAIAIVPPSIQFTVGRPMDSILRDLVEDKGKLSVREGATVTAQEIGFVIATQWKEDGSKSIRQANMLRVARNLPPVKDGEKEIPAFDYLKEQLWNARLSDGQFYNVFQLPEALDFMEANADKLGDKSSVFTIKDVLGKMRAEKAFGEDLKLAKKLPAKVKGLVDALKEGATQKRIRELADKLGVKKRAKAKKKADTSTDTTKVVHTVESVVLALTTARGQWDLAVNDGVKIEDLRKAALDELNALALLSGHALVPIAKK